ncbi:hypothetical protein TNCV_3573261 [Trichonephila clavipes]|nr:hypothetical protein TNCV_3573261 [Trichonephila clavipes]
MSNSEDDSSAEVKNKVQDTPHLKSTEKSLKTDSALQNAKEDYEASAAPSYFKQQTEKISIKPDLPNVRISEDIKKSTKAAQKMPVEAVSWQNRKSCSQDSSERYKDSKKTSEIKPGTSKRISEDKCSSHLSDTSRNLSTTSSKIKTQLISDAFKTAPTDKSVFKLIASELEVEAKRIDLLLARNVDLTKCEVQRVLYPTVVSEEVAESSPTAQSGCVKQKIGKQNQPSLNQEKSQNVQTNPLDSVREVANAKKSKTSTNASASKDYKYPPGTYYAEPLKKGPDSPSVKSIVKIFEDMTLQEDCRKEMERKQRLGKSKDSKQRISDIAPEKIQSSSITRTSFPNERSFISPGKVQPRSRINLSNERISSFISTESKTRTGVPNTKMSLIDSDKTPPRSKARKSLPNKRTSPLINKEKAQPRRRTRISFPNESTRLSRPEKGQLSSRARTSFLDDGKYSLISPEMVRSISRTNLSNEKISLMNTENNRTIGITNKRISPLTGTETNQPSKTKISFPDARDSSVISPEKIPLGSEERISLLNEKTSLSSPEKVQLGSETIGIPNKRISPLIGTVTNQPSKTKISLPDARSSVISPEDIQLGSKARISPLNEKTLSSPEKSQLGSRSRINLLNENSLPKKQSENVTVPSYAGRPGIAASDTQPSIQSNTVPAVRTLKYEEIRSSSTERQSDSKDAEFPGCLSSENKDLAQYSFEFQGAIAIEHPSTIITNAKRIGNCKRLNGIGESEGIIGIRGTSTTSP